MMQHVFLSLVATALTLIPVLNIHADQDLPGVSLRQDEQLPGKMYTAMDERPRIAVGQADADLIGSDNRALQAAVDYIAGLGGGIVEIGPGQYTMRDSLHLRPNVTVRGTKGKTILRKADGVVSALAADGDFGEEQITVEDPTGFAVGYGVAILEDGVSGFHITTARIKGQRKNVLAISKPLMSDCMVNSHARAATVFPVVSVYHAENVRIENLIIEGNKAGNVLLNGCRGAGIFLYQGHGATIRGCITRNYNGDGIGFQQSNDVTVIDCVSEHNAVLGMHPGSGSQRPVVRNCIARHNGTDGLFLCWRVKYGTFEDNLMEQNGRFGISIGHKDSDNLFRHNTICRNKQHGLFFRNETEPMAPHRNRFEENVIENNGGAEIRIRGQVRDLVFKNNVIGDTQEKGDENIGVQIEETVGPVQLDNNVIETPTTVDDQRS
jgi:Right handed beta helix region